MPKAFNTPGPIRTMLREMKLRLRARRPPKLDTPPAAKSVLPRPVVVTPGRGDQEGQHLVADGDEVGPVLQGLELRLYGFSSLTRGRLWLLVTPRSASNIATGLERIEVPQVGMQGELPAGDAFLVAGGGDEFVGELGRLPWRDHPADYVAAEHLEVT
jgi:hypothetical protein